MFLCQPDNKFKKMQNLKMFSSTNTSCFTSTRVPLVNMNIKSWCHKWCFGASQIKVREIDEAWKITMNGKSWFQKWCSGARHITNSRNCVVWENNQIWRWVGLRPPEHHLWTWLSNHEFVSGALVLAKKQIREKSEVWKSSKYGNVLFYVHESTTYENGHEIMIS